MSSYIVYMSPLAFTIVNVPVSVSTILMNMFYVYCMFSSQEGCQKPPLNVLVGSLIGCNLLLNICNLLFVMYKTVYVPIWAYVASCALILYAMRTSFTASLGLNVFYYFQIVPARHPCLIWVKTHIKVFVYFMLVFDRIFFSFAFILQVLPGRVFFSPVDFNSSIPLNFTSTGLIVRYYLILTDFWLRCCYCYFCLGIMVASNTSTVLYLWKHVKSMENSSSLSALHYRKQKRVTIMSIIQTVLFFLSSGWLITDELMFRFHIDFSPAGHVLFSIVACYAFGTTIILGVSQSKFRLRALDVVNKLGQMVFRSNLNVDDGNVNCQNSKL